MIGSLFNGEHFEKFYTLLRDRSKARISLDLHPSIVHIGREPSHQTTITPCRCVYVDCSRRLLSRIDNERLQTLSVAGGRYSDPRDGTKTTQAHEANSTAALLSKYDEDRDKVDAVPSDTRSISSLGVYRRSPLSEAHKAVVIPLGGLDGVFGKYFGPWSPPGEPRLVA